MNRVKNMIGACLLGGLAAHAVAAPSPATNRPLASYKTSDHFVKCPAGVHAKIGCVELTGKALSATHWPDLRRLAVVDAPSAALPAGCATASTTGTLSGTSGSVHFKASGYYCPKTDTAWYRLDFDAADAKRFDLPLHGIIRYDGPRNTETFSTTR